MVDVPDRDFICIGDPSGNQAAGVAATRIDHDVNSPMKLAEHLIAGFAVLPRIFSLKHIPRKNPSDERQIETTGFEDLLALRGVELESAKSSNSPAVSTTKEPRCGVFENPEIRWQHQSPSA